MPTSPRFATAVAAETTKGPESPPESGNKYETGKFRPYVELARQASPPAGEPLCHGCGCTLGKKPRRKHRKGIVSSEGLVVIGDAMPAPPDAHLKPVTFHAECFRVAEARAAKATKATAALRCSFHAEARVLRSNGRGGTSLRCRSCLRDGERRYRDRNRKRKVRNAAKRAARARLVGKPLR